MARRTTVTILFCDLVGSTALLQRIGEAANDELRRDVFGALRRPIELLGGEEVKSQGDGLMAAFAGPASDAIACAVAWQQAIDALARRDPELRLALRVGLSTGEATAEEHDWFGTPVVEAARLCGAAGPGQILVSDAVRLVAGDAADAALTAVGALALKGFDEPRPAYAVQWVPTAHDAAIPRPPLLDTSGAVPFAGRAGELDMLARAIDGARAGARRTMLVAGPAGSGKTRLIAEAARAANTTTALAGRAPGSGDFGPFAEALRWYAAAAAPERLRRVLGDDAGALAARVPAITLRLPELAHDGHTEVDVEHTIDAFVAVLARMSAEQPLVLVVDDLHAAAGPTLAVFLELATSPNVRQLALVGAFRTDERGAAGPALATLLDKLDDAPDAARVDLGPLDAGAVVTMAGETTVDVEAVHAATGGNPAAIVDALRRLAHDNRDPGRALALAVPFRGLVAYRAEDAALFFGRDAAIATLLGRLATGRFAAIVGTSGSGKSSLVFAGLVPALDAGRLPGTWTIAAMTPGTHPAGWLETALAHDAPRLLLVDQLEECVTQCDDPRERAEFLDRLADLATRRGAGTRVVVTVRADLLGAVAAASNAFAALVEAGSMFLGPMTGEELRATIEGPAEAAGLRLEPGLVDIVLRDVAGEPGALPLLSHAMLETWKRRRGATLSIANYREAGGARGAIARSADVVFEALDPRGQALARELFLRLTELGEGVDDTRRRITIADAASIGDLDDVGPLLEQLTAARLITTDEGTVEVAHEALIREWPRLRAWLDESRDELRLAREVERRAESWARLDRPVAELLRGGRLDEALEQVAMSSPSDIAREYLDASRDQRDREAIEATRRVRRLRALLATALVLLLIAAAAGVVARNQSQRADDRAREAREQGRITEVQRVAAEAIATAETDLRVALPLAVEGFRLADRFETRNALLTALRREPRLLGFLPAPDGGYRAGAALDPPTNRAALPHAGGVDLWDLETRTLLATLPITGVADLAFADDDRLVVATDSSTDVWDTERAERVATIAQPAVSVATRGELLAIGGLDGTVALATTDGAVVARAEHGAGDVLVAWAGDDTLVTAGTEPDEFAVTPDGLAPTVYARDAATLAPRGERIGSFTSPIGDLAVSPDGETIAVAGQAALLAQFLRLDGTVPPGSVDVDAIFGGGATNVAFVDDVTAVSVGASGRTVVTSFAGAAAPDLVTQVGTVQALLTNPERAEAWAIGAGAVGWALDGRDALGGVPTGDALVPIALSPDGHTLLALSTAQHESEAEPVDPGEPTVGSAVSITKLVYALDAATLEPRREPWPGGPSGFVADGRVVSSEIERYVLTDVATGAIEPLELIAPPFDLAVAPVLSADGRRVALTALDGSVSILDTADGSTLAELTFETASDGTRRRTVVFGPGELVAATDGNAVLVAGSAAPRRIDLGDLVPSALAFSPDGALLAVGGPDGAIRLVTLAEGVVEGTWLAGHTGPVAAITFSPDGALVASTASDNTTRLFDLAVRRPYGPAFASESTSVPLFSADSSALYVGTRDGIVRIDLRLDSLVARACEIAGTNLSRAAWDLYLPGREPGATCDQFPPP